MKKDTLLPVAIASTAFALALVLGAGCRSTFSEQRDLMVDDLTAGERPVAMTGAGAFLEGKLMATATVSRGFDRGMKAESRGGRGKGKDKGFGDSYPVSHGDSDEEQKEAMEDYMRLVRAQRAQGSPMPPVTLRVQFENRGTEPLEVAVTDVNSDLGNFAVRPEKLTIAPGASGALDPMISQLGVTSDEIPIKIAVRVAGKTETQVIAVKSILAAPVKK